MDYWFSAAGSLMCTVQPGEYRITARAPGYRPTPQLVNIASGDSRELTIVLDRE